MAGDLMAHRRNATVIDEQTKFATLRDQARTAIATLQAIRDDANVTNAEAVTYLKDEAQIMQRVIRVVVGTLA